MVIENPHIRSIKLERLRVEKRKQTIKSQLARALDTQNLEAIQIARKKRIGFVNRNIVSVEWLLMFCKNIGEKNKGYEYRTDIGINLNWYRAKRIEQKYNWLAYKYHTLLLIVSTETQKVNRPIAISITLYERFSKDNPSTPTGIFIKHIEMLCFHNATDQKIKIARKSTKACI